MQIPAEVLSFFKKEKSIAVASIDSRGKIHCSIKGLIEVKPSGEFYILDLYKATTYQNIRNNPNITIFAVDQVRYKGYALQGVAEVVNIKDSDKDIHEKWNKNVAERIAQRLVKNVQKGAGVYSHPESAFGKPLYLFLFRTEKIIDLANT